MSESNKDFMNLDEIRVSIHRHQDLKGIKNPDFWEWCRYVVFAVFVVLFLASTYTG